MNDKKAYQKLIKSALAVDNSSAPETIIQWKKYLKAKGLYQGDVTTNYQNDAFKIGMQNLEMRITAQVPAAIGMIWRNGQINPIASIADVEESLQLLSYNIVETKPLISEAAFDLKAALEKIKKIGVANFDALGPPDDPELIGTPFKQMFISQEDSKANETDLTQNQNQGTWQNPAPKNLKKEPELKNPVSDIDDRMSKLLNLIDQVQNNK